MRRNLQFSVMSLVPRFPGGPSLCALLLLDGCARNLVESYTETVAGNSTIVS